jgi:hypothetical protein
MRSCSLIGQLQPEAGACCFDAYVVDTIARYGGRYSTEAIVEQLLSKSIPVGKEKHFLHPSALHEYIDETHGLSGLADTRSHDEKSASFAGTELEMLVSNRDTLRKQ